MVFHDEGFLGSVVLFEQCFMELLFRFQDGGIHGGHCLSKLPHVVGLQGQAGCLGKIADKQSPPGDMERGLCDVQPENILEGEVGACKLIVWLGVYEFNRVCACISVEIQKLVVLGIAQHGPVVVERAQQVGVGVLGIITNDFLLRLQIHL